MQTQPREIRNGTFLSGINRQSFAEHRANVAIGSNPYSIRNHSQDQRSVFKVNAREKNDE